MEPKPDFERFRKAARREEPDRVPLCELLVEHPVQSRFLGRPVEPGDMAAQVEFYARAGYDFVPVTVGMMSPGKVTKESDISRFIREVMLKDASEAERENKWNIEYTSFISDRRDFERFPWEEAGKLDFSKVREAARLLPEGMKVVVLSGKVFTLTWMLMGFNNFAMKLILEEDLVADVFRRVAEIQFGALQEMFAMPEVGAVWAVDDIAFGGGPMISPQALRDHVFPWYREIARRCHENGRLFIMHSDGDVRPVMEDLIALGLDVLQPIDPTCLDIAAIKREYGDRLCIAGNVPNELLRSGSPAEVEEYVKKLLREVAPGGGFCLGSGNSVTEWSAFENYMAMRNAALENGTYPIRL